MEKALEIEFNKLKPATLIVNQPVKRKTIKPVTLNLCNDPLPDHHRNLPDLGPKFVPNQPRIPSLNIISKTESEALIIK